MKQFPKGITFKYPWRKYQARVLDELDTHLDDNHLHLIAPPGSGKTILGLEVALRLNKPTLIFAPTISIQNQWIQRFTELFLQTEQTPDWISTDIRNPNLLTVITYQAIFAARKKEIEEKEKQFNQSKNTSNKSKTSLIDRLKKQKIGTIIVDEAHHLKNAWWQALTWLKEELKPTVVGLTATPPYDVSPLEWQRYSLLNGPVDAEISVPELVAEGDLCPHQDYVYFSEPSQEEQQKISTFKKKVKTLFQKIKTDDELINIIKNHPMFLEPKLHFEWI
jgi:superfamily II DNA or RNA helicase